MSVEKKTELCFLYNNDGNLNEADPLMSGQYPTFALKDDGMESWCVLVKVLLRPGVYIVQEFHTASDPRDFMKSFRQENCRMFKLRTDLTPSQKTAVNSIIDQCSSRPDGWPVNAITEMESRGLLNGEQKAKAIENRRNSVDIRTFSIIGPILKPTAHDRYYAFDILVCLFPLFFLE
jgi:hypothetical protein